MYPVRYPLLYLRIKLIDLHRHNEAGSKVLSSSRFLKIFAGSVSLNSQLSKTRISVSRSVGARGESLMIRTKLAISLVFSIVIMAGCSSVPRQGEAFKRELLPERTIRVMVVAEDISIDNQEKIARLLQECTEVFEPQVGIRFKVAGYVGYNWKTSLAGRSEMTNGLEELILATNGMDFDIAMGFPSLKPSRIPDYLLRNLVFGYEGMIDDVYRRYILIKDPSKFVMVHELAHAFVFAREHSHNGPLASVAWRLFPFTPIIAPTDYLFPEKDRKEIAHNKYRCFGSWKPPVTEGVDIVSVPVNADASQSC